VALERRSATVGSSFGSGNAPGKVSGRVARLGACRMRVDKGRVLCGFSRLAGSGAMGTSLDVRFEAFRFPWLTAGPQDGTRTA
jgi:hypothetical protein